MTRDGDAADAGRRRVETRRANEGAALALFETPSPRLSVACECGGLLKPDVVFFGENVPKERVDATLAALEAAKSLLVVGSSLMVFSGYRFVRAAARLGRPIAVVNRGVSRADPVAAVKLAGEAGQSLREVAECLGSATLEGGDALRVL